MQRALNFVERWGIKEGVNQSDKDISPTIQKEEIVWNVRTSSFGIPLRVRHRSLFKPLLEKTNKAIKLEESFGHVEEQLQKLKRPPPPGQFDNLLNYSMIVSFCMVAKNTSKKLQRLACLGITRTMLSSIGKVGGNLPGHTGLKLVMQNKQLENGILVSLKNG